MFSWEDYPGSSGWGGGNFHTHAHTRVHTRARQREDAAGRVEDAALEDLSDPSTRHRIPETGRGKGGIPPRASRGSGGPQTPWCSPHEADFGLLVSETVREYISIVLWSFLTVAAGNRHRPFLQPGGPSSTGPQQAPRSAPGCLLAHPRWPWREPPITLSSVAL